VAGREKEDFVERERKMEEIKLERKRSTPWFSRKSNKYTDQLNLTIIIYFLRTGNSSHFGQGLDQTLEI
jgi:hypothetical protein